MLLQLIQPNNCKLPNNWVSQLKCYICTVCQKRDVNVDFFSYVCLPLTSPRLRSDFVLFLSVIFFFFFCRAWSHCIHQKTAPPNHQTCMWTRLCSLNVNKCATTSCVARNQGPSIPSSQMTQTSPLPVSPLLSTSFSPPACPIPASYSYRWNPARVLGPLSSPNGVRDKALATNGFDAF